MAGHAGTVCGWHQVASKVALSCVAAAAAAEAWLGGDGDEEEEEEERYGSLDNQGTVSSRCSHHSSAADNIAH